jgi:predicted site-specific integrase-resolvase
VTETSTVKLRGDEISVSARQAARLIGLPLRTLQAETKAGKIPAARRVGRRYVYLIEELKRMVENSVRPGVS